MVQPETLTYESFCENEIALRHLLYGSQAGIDRTIKILHALSYADPNDWSDPMPVPPNGVEGSGNPSQWMVIMTRILLLE